MTRKLFGSRINRWINRRIPRSDSQTLTQKNLFILPTGAGMVFGILLVVMLLTGINYQNSLIYLLVFMLGALFVGAMHQTHRNLSGLELSLLDAGEGEAGSEIPFRFRLTRAGNDSLAVSLSAGSAVISGIHVPAGESRDIHLPVPSSKRGYVRPDRVRIETRFPFGLLKAWSWLRPASAGIALPRPLPAPDVPGGGEGAREDTDARPIVGQDQADLRPWREGDLTTRVMWKRFARSGQMVVADWESLQSSPDWLDFEAFPGVDVELRLSYLAWQVRERLARGERFGLNLPGETIEPDAGDLHAQRCLRALAVWGLEKPRDTGAMRYGTRSGVDAAPGVGAV